MTYFYFGSDLLFSKLTKEIGFPNIAVTNKKVTRDLPQVEFLHHKKCKNAIYDFQDLSSIPPLSKKDLLKYASVEQIYLKMADRLGFIQSYQQRKDEFNKHLRFWIWKLSKHDSRFALFENVPHEGYNYIIYCILKANKTKVITFYQLPIRPGKTYLLQAVFDIFNHGSEIKNFISSDIKNNKTITPEIAKKFEGYFDLENRIVSNIESFTRHNVVSPLNYLSKIFNLFSKFKKIQRHSIADIKKILAMRMGYDKYLSSNSALIKYYNKNAVTPSLKIPYIYFTFHYQPELSTSPLGGVFVDQILACEILAFAAKKLNIYLYVKEHPRGSKAQYTKAHNSYQRLLSYSNVKLLSNKINTYELIDSSLCTSTITGSSGWESLMRKKPVLMFGSRFYEACYGAFSVSSVNDVTKALLSILNGDIKITNDKINEFLSALDKVTIEAFTDRGDENIATVSLDKSLINKVEMIKRLTI